MCLALLAYDPTPEIAFLLLHNRDESRSRTFRDPRWIERDGRRVFAGIDERAGGTWLSLGEDGSLAFVVNIRKRSALFPAPGREPASRGELPFRALAEGMPSLADSLRPHVADYGAFLLVRAGPDGAVESFSNLDGALGCARETRFTTFSNHLPGTGTGSDRDGRWPKERRLEARVRAILESPRAKGKPPAPPVLAGEFLDALGDRATEEKGLPTDTGFSPAEETRLSAVSVDMPDRDYGTVLSTVILRMRDGRTYAAFRNRVTGAESGLFIG